MRLHQTQPLGSFEGLDDAKVMLYSVAFGKRGLPYLSGARLPVDATTLRKRSHLGRRS